MAKCGRGRAKNSGSREDAAFFKVFQPDLHSHQLMIPPDYMTYFRRTVRDRVILKDADGKIWHVSVESTRNGVFLRSGWQRFINHHHLSVGEFLVFRYDKTYSFLVNIYGINGCKKQNFPAIDEITTRVKHEEITTRVKDEEITKSKQTLGKRARPHDEETNASLDSCKCSFFVSPLTHPNQYRVEIPKKIVKRYNLHGKSEMMLRNAKGKEWQVRVNTYDGYRGYIGKGWSQFRTDNRLGPKDSCQFTFDAEKASRIIRVQILRCGSHKLLR